MKKDEKLRRGLNGFLSEQDVPAKVEGVLNRMTDGDKSVPERLWVLWTRIKELRTEAEDLSSLLEYHSGSRLSQVVDSLTQAESLTDETISLTRGETPTKEFRVVERENYWEIWDDEVGFGIGFRKGDEDSRRHLMFIRSEEYLSDWDGEDDEEMIQRLVSFAEKRFPQEFRLRIVEDEKTRTIWDDSVGIGLRFEIGDRLARHRLTDIVRDRSILTTEEGMRLLTETRERLLSFAENNFEEFAPPVV